jgi:hypothetical protein
VRIFLVDTLTFDGFFNAKFDILKPRWLPTARGVTGVSRGSLKLSQLFNGISRLFSFRGS